MDLMVLVKVVWILLAIGFFIISVVENRRCDGGGVYSICSAIYCVLMAGLIDM